MEDSEIVMLYLQRREQAIEETAAKYGNYCHTIAYNILQDRLDAEEAVSDTYLGAWNAIPPHRPAILSTFLGKLTRRISIKRWQFRRAQKRGGGEMDLALEELADCIPSGRTVEQELEMAELSKLLNRFVLALPQTEQSVFLCRYWYLDSISAVAKRFGFSESKVKSMLSRTRKKLYAYLQKEGIDL